MSCLRETNKRIEEINSSLEVTKHQGEESSDMTNSLWSHHEDLNKKINNVAENMKRLECNVLQVENKVSTHTTALKGNNLNA